MHSIFFLLFFSVPPLLTAISFQNDRLYEGAHARVTCGVTGGDLPISFQWLKDGRAIPMNFGITIHDVDEYSSILSISSVTSQHSGNYTCIASNSAASSNFTAPLTVNGKNPILLNHVVMLLPFYTLASSFLTSFNSSPAVY